MRAAGPSLSVTANPSQRFFVGGFVYSDSAMLSRFDAAKFEAMILTAKQQGQSVVRWNCFLKGLDLTFGPDGLVAGVKRGGFEAVRAGLDIAQSHGILLQLVLATAHFLRCGWGGCENTLMNVKNSDRVARNHIMMATPRGVAAYLENIVDPLMSSIGHCCFETGAPAPVQSGQRHGGVSTARRRRSLGQRRPALLVRLPRRALPGQHLGARALSSRLYDCPEPS